MVEHAQRSHSDRVVVRRSIELRQPSHRAPHPRAGVIAAALSACTALTAIVAAIVLTNGSGSRERSVDGTNAHAAYETYASFDAPISGARLGRPRGSDVAGVAPLPREKDDKTAAAPAPDEEVVTGAGGIDPATLIARGDVFLAQSDVVAARLFYERAYDAGSARGATALAGTYDPLVFDQRGIRGASSDPATAAEWYGRAVAIGDPDAEQRLRALHAYVERQAYDGSESARALLERWPLGVATPRRK